SDPEHKAYCAVKEERERYVAMLTLAIDRNAKVSADGPNGFAPPPGPPPPGLREGGRPPKAQWIKDRLAAVVPGLKPSLFWDGGPAIFQVAKGGGHVMLPADARQNHPA